MMTRPFCICIFCIIKRSCWTKIKKIAHSIIWKSCFITRLNNFALFFFLLHTSEILSSHVVSLWLFIHLMLLEFFIVWWWMLLLLSLILIFFASIVKCYLFLASTPCVLCILHGLWVCWWLTHYFKTSARELSFHSSSVWLMASWSLSWSAGTSRWQALVLRGWWTKNLIQFRARIIFGWTLWRILMCSLPASIIMLTVILMLFKSVVSWSCTFAPILIKNDKIVVLRDVSIQSKMLAAKRKKLFTWSIISQLLRRNPFNIKH